ncbi:beta-alanine-activating enzyme [Spea bombifrons]|uniref:beta-alanine-activating enzyme n=1 Tax=Spea bombifrons TaxID=233779 RepID=UPI00234A5EA5|nr:beta-alanine-activating enzyme [Spea bombifrons]
MGESHVENGETTAVPMQWTLHGMVLRAASQHEHKNAVCYHNIEQPPSFLTYKAVICLADELTGFLKSHRAPAKNSNVGIYCSPGIHLPSWIIGILQVPAAYCPLDPGNPSHLTSSLMERIGMKFMLVENNKAESFQLMFSGWTQHDSSSVRHLDVTLFEKLMDDEANISHKRDQPNALVNLNVKQTSSNEEHVAPSQISGECIDVQDGHCLAYILHTSGTTGAPKIVSVPHRCIVPNIHHLRSIFDMSPADLLFLASPLTFDPSVIEMFLALSSGACLLIVPDTIKIMPPKLCDVFQQHCVTVMQVTPTFLRRFGSHSIRSSVLSRDTSLRVLALGGEPFPAISVIRRWRQPGNKTRIFNLYGITEVSSWATYYEIPEEILISVTGHEPLVPLGHPLYGTTVEVQNDQGCTIHEGEGQVLLGGRERICFIDEEVKLPFGTMRKTGDWVTIKDGDIFFLGRKDNQIKRHGKRLSLEYVQQVVESLDHVETCAISWFEARQLIIFVISKGLVEERSLWKDLRAHLLSYAVPDNLVLIDSLPLTKHGKIDNTQLNLIYSEKKRKTTYVVQGGDNLWEKLQTIWKSVLGLSEDSPAVAKESVFLLSGGDSLTAMRFQEEVDTLLGNPVPGLLEVILSNNIMAIHRHISKYVEKLDITDTMAITKNPKDTITVYKTENGSGKRKGLFLTEPEEDVNSFISLSKGNRLFVNVHLPSECPAQICHWLNGSHKVKELLKPDSEWKRPKNTQSIANNHRSLNSNMSETHMLGNALESPLCTQILSMNLRWESDTSKCVDASPLLVKPASVSSPVTVYIGSHSHRVQALDLLSGQVVWERVLGDRIESSASLSKCGNFVLIGCYDGSLYSLNRHDGETHWIFTTEDAIKSSPTVDPLSGLTYVGSHDHHLYALDIDAKQCIWKSYCGGGAVFSSPCISSTPYHVYAATLGGLLMAVNPATGDSIWTFVCGKPLFASPQCNQDHVFIGCVDESFYCLSHAGEKVWNVRTSGPIFSSACLSALKPCVP